MPHDPTRACIEPEAIILPEEKKNRNFPSVVDGALDQPRMCISSLAGFASCIMKERPSAMDLRKREKYNKLLLENMRISALS